MTNAVIGWLGGERMTNHVITWMEQEGIVIRTPRKPPAQVFIRFGKWGRRPRSLNHASGEAERGLSVYRATLHDDLTVELLVDDPELSHSIQSYAFDLSGRLVFAVTGKVVGRGSDGEPVLVNVRLLPYAIRTPKLIGWGL